MKLYKYEELEKLNQALRSFKENNVLVLEVKLLVIDNKACYFVLANLKDKPKVKKVKKEAKEKTETKENKETNKIKKESKKEEK